MADTALTATNANLQARWSDYGAPKPSKVVDVTTKDEVAAMVYIPDQGIETELSLTTHRSSVAHRTAYPSLSRTAGVGGPKPQVSVSAVSSLT
jgi:hypothetical protein